MNKKSWLIVGLSFAMAASIGVGISACGGKEPDTPPTPTEHTHTYDAWDYNETQHWKYCDEHGTDKSNIDETTREPHHFVEGVCDKCEAKEPAMYVYGIGPSLYGNGKWPNLMQVRDTKDKWVKMELGDDGAYTADVYLTPDDKFAVGNVTTLKSYPGEHLTDALQVETANTYTVTFDPADKTVTFAVHAHTYVWKYDADQHWKVCSTRDQTVDESSRGTHSYDPETHECVCGAVETVSCEHSNGCVFDYEELPAVEADGGTLQKVCPDCGDTQDVTYSKGFTGNGATPIQPTNPIGDISEAGTYYFTTGSKYQTLGMKVTEAGAYTFTFEEVFDSDAQYSADGQLGIKGLAFGSAYVQTFSIPTSCVVYGNGGVSLAPPASTHFTAYSVKINGKTPATGNDLVGALATFSFTVTAEQLSSGDVYVTLHLSGYKNDAHTTSAAENSLSHLVTVTKSAATAASVAPVEVAMLPEKKD